MSPIIGARGGLSAKAWGFTSSVAKSIGTWTRVGLGANANNMRQILGNSNGKAVIVQYTGSGSPYYFYSSNGTSWSSTNSGTVNTLAVCWDGTYFNCLTYSGSSYSRSTDGSSWSSGSISNASNWSGIAYGLSTFVASSRSNIVAYGANINSISTNVTIWSGSSMDGRVLFNPVSNTFLVLNASVNTSTHYTSTNGSSFTSRTSPVTLATGSVANGLFFVQGAGNTNTYYTSSDGVTWTTRSTLPSTVAWYGFTYVNETYIAFGQGTTAYSSDGINWTTKSISITGSPSWPSQPPSAVGNYAIYMTDGTTNDMYYLSVT